MLPTKVLNWLCKGSAFTEADYERVFLPLFGSVSSSAVPGRGFF